jgi:DnaJ-class molecular chaperone
VSRSRLISTYRTLAAQHHPDRFHDADPQAREAAAARFIEISDAYGQLLAVIEDIDPEKKV